ncbi:MAG: GIY-YIG nuclease family protein [Lewinellaceae bacterium]|nr:GIY-YIG nuclease family protein [Lewinellaceae bacterium]
MAFITYILYSRKLRRFYVGYTTDMMKRLNQHNRGEGGYTQQGS